MLEISHIDDRDREMNHGSERPVNLLALPDDALELPELAEASSR